MALTTIKGGEAATGQGPAAWSEVLRSFRCSQQPLAPPWEDLFGPLRIGSVDDLMVIGQLGQSLDGRIATEAGKSHYINTAAGLTHLHRLRALVDAVVIGVGTAVADDPQLTVRRVEGANPARVVIDPHGRLPAHARLLAEDGVRRVVVTTAGRKPSLPRNVELVPLQAERGHIDPRDILAALAAAGFRRLLIEGGAETVSRFLAAGCLDRLHIIVAPLILGAGRASLTLPPVDLVEHALRPPVRAHILETEVLFDCDLSGQRVATGRAKKST
jgi:diaminohydroxyphosphoribosylaminopyrimidine deaminase/5-amino-6-(5-phosphoribosylamino)uracil reductase